MRAPPSERAGCALLLASPFCPAFHTIHTTSAGARQIQRLVWRGCTDAPMGFPWALAWWVPPPARGVDASRELRPATCIVPLSDRPVSAL
eukprot:19370-Chlamydomonas_euryale.AAC.9